MNRETVYQIIEENNPDLLGMILSDEELLQMILEIGKEEEESLETGIDWDWVRNDLDDQEWYESDGGFDEERQVFLGTCFALMPSGKYYMPWACGNVESCPVCEGKTSYGEMTCDICRGEGKRGLHPDDDISNFDLIHEGEMCVSCQETGKIGIPCDYCQSVGSREAYLDQLMQEKLDAEAEEYDLFITTGEGDPCDIMAGEIREIEED